MLSVTRGPDLRSVGQWQAYELKYRSDKNHVTAGRWVAKQSSNVLEILHLLNVAYRALACLTG